MNDFKVGDRVEYVGIPPRGNSKVFTIAKVLIGQVDVVEDPSFHPWTKNLRLIAPDALTIPRSELPEVVERDGALWAIGLQYGLSFPAAKHRAHALAQLAVSEFLATREKAEQEAADQHAAILKKRRDELIQQFMPEAVRASNLPTWDEINPTCQRAINYAIQLEGQVKK